MVHGISVLALIAVLAWPSVAEPQTEKKVRRIGLLTYGSKPTSNRHPVIDALKALGYLEGRNVAFEERYASESTKRLAEHAADLASLKVDLIVAVATQAAQAAQRATKTIPIVFVATVDPVSAGLVSSLGRPGANLTGTSLLSPQLSAKRLELLQEIVPKLEEVGVLLNASNPSHESQLVEVQEAALSRGIRLRSLPIRTGADIDTALRAEATTGIDALIAIDDPTITRERVRVAELAKERRIPAISGFPAFAESGFLASYGPDLRQQFRDAASYVHRILEGARPADLPVEQPTTFHLVVNTKTARALKISVPRAVLLRADQVIK